jgi:hypothetical protein
VRLLSRVAVTVTLAPMEGGGGGVTAVYLFAQESPTAKQDNKIDKAGEKQGSLLVSNPAFLIY